MALVRELEEHVGAQGWDQPPRLFALVPTAALAAAEPELAARMSLHAGAPGWTPVEQEDLPAHADLGDLLAQLAWPRGVDGVALVAERVVLPGEAEAAVVAAAAEQGQDAASVAAGHPRREELRVVVATTRSGAAASAVRLRRLDELLTGPDLLPALRSALATTLLD